MQSFLDTDLSRLTLHQAVRQLFPRATASYQLVNRSGTRVPQAFARWLADEVAQWQDSIVCTEDDLDFLHSTDFFSADYLEMLPNFRFDPGCISIAVTDAGDLKVSIEGTWQSVSLWEAPLLAAISELYYKRVEHRWCRPESISDYRRYIRRKADHLLANDCAFAESSVRNRRSPLMQEAALRACREANRDAGGTGFDGTSNPHFARTLRLPVVDAMPQEWVAAHSVFSGLRTANRDAMLRWMQVQGHRQHAVPADTYSAELFFESFERVLAESYSTLIVHSADPLPFIHDALNFYEARGLDSREKTLLFAEQVDAEMAIKIRDCTEGRTNVIFSLPPEIHHADTAGPRLQFCLKAVNGRPVRHAVETPFAPQTAQKPSDQITGSGDKSTRRISYYTP